MNEEKMHLDRLRKERDYHEIIQLPIDEDELLSRYEKLFSGLINDVLRENLLLDQALPSGIVPLREEMTVAGFAFTIKSSKDTTTLGEMEMRGKMLQDIKKNDICVWYTGGDDQSGHWGEVMTVTTKVRGCKAAVLDGGLRDTKGVLEQNFPVFYKYRTSNGSLGRCKMIAYQVPIRIGNPIIYPGDLIFGDIDGVVVVPRKMAYDVLLRAEALVESEEEIKSWIEDGMTPKEVVEKGGYF